MNMLRIGEAAELLGVGVETVRRWGDEGKIALSRTPSGQRKVPLSELRRLLDERRAARPERTIKAQSARNQFPGTVVRVERDGVAAVVEVAAGPHRLVSLMTREAADELDLREGTEVICVVKATNVIVEIPS